MPVLDAQLLPAIAGLLRDPALREELVRKYCDALNSLWKEYCATVAETKESIEELREREDKLTNMYNNILETIEDCGRTPRLSQRLQEIEKELEQVMESQRIAADVATPPPPEEDIRALITGKMEEFDSALSSDRETVKHKLSLHIDKLKMDRVDVAQGPRYEVSGEIRVFETGDPEDVLLAGSFQRSCKQYAPLAFPLKTSLIVRAGEWEKKTKSIATRKRIGDANRRRWAQKKATVAA